MLLWICVGNYGDGAVLNELIGGWLVDDDDDDCGGGYLIMFWFMVSSMIVVIGIKQCWGMMVRECRRLLEWGRKWWGKDDGLRGWMRICPIWSLFFLLKSSSPHQLTNNPSQSYPSHTPLIPPTPPPSHLRTTSTPTIIFQKSSQISNYHTIITTPRSSSPPHPQISESFPKPALDTTTAIYPPTHTPTYNR